eukprot:1492087-Rhodomonas_salina.1
MALLGIAVLCRCCDRRSKASRSRRKPSGALSAPARNQTRETAVLVQIVRRRWFKRFDFGVCGTDIGDAACYAFAMCGTELAYCVAYAMYGAELMSDTRCAVLSQRMVLRTPYGMSSTELASDARCAVRI